MDRIKMWFVSAHEPTTEQIADAEQMGCELIWVRSPELKKDSDIGELWLQLLRSLPIRRGDILVVMGAPQWVSWIARAHQASLDFMDGYIYRVYFTNSLNEEVEFREITLYTVYTERISEEQRMPDGTVRKVSIFKHGGFIPI